jgi:hypothetical protein
LPSEVDVALDDLSDVAVHPKSGHIFLHSDETSALAEVEVVTVIGRDCTFVVRVIGARSVTSSREARSK